MINPYAYTFLVATRQDHSLRPVNKPAASLVSRVRTYLDRKAPSRRA